MDALIMEIDDNNKIQQQNGDSAVMESMYEVNLKATSNSINLKQDHEIKTEMQLLIEQIKPSSYGQKRNYSSIDISAEKWLMAYDAESMAKLENPPSLADGISQELEKEIRYLGCELIQSGAILLKLNQTAAATGQILFQRFYYQKSFVRYNFEHMVMACLLLASKIEEEPRKPRDVLNVYNRLKQFHQHRRRLNSISNKNGIAQQQQQRPRKFEHLELGGRQYLHMKNAVIKAERRILNTLGFVVHVHHPHKLIYIYLFILGLLRKTDDSNASAEEISKSSQLLQQAWSYMNDGLRTDMFLRYPPETIACACIQLAVKTVDQPIVLPKDPFPWFELFDASDRDIRVISEMLLNLYRRKKAPSMEWILMQLEKQQQKLADEEKAKQTKELAERKEAILQRISETAAVKGTGEEAVRLAKSTSEMEKVKTTTNKHDPIKDRLSGNGRMDNSKDRDKSPRKERKEEKRRRSKSRDRQRSGKDRQREHDERDKQHSKRSDSRDYKNRRKEHRTRSRSPILSETKRDKKMDRRQK